MLVLALGVQAAVQVIPTDGRNIWSVAVGRLNGPTRPAVIVGGAFDGRVCAFTAEGKHLWDAPTGGFIFNLLCADLDGDGYDEILAGAADGKAWNRDPRLGPGISREQLAEFAGRMERDKAPFWAVVGHGARPFIDLETARAILAAAPTTCLGFNVSEHSQPERLADYLDLALLPLMELLPADGSKNVVLLEKQGWWAVVAAMPEIRDRLFAPRYRKILVPTVEESNCRALDLNVVGRFGLWRSAMISKWCSRMIADNYCFLRNEDREYVLNGHPHLRHMVTQAAAGTTDFHFVFGQRNRRDGGWTIEGEQAIAPFLDMLGKGIIAPPSRDQVRGLSPVVLEIDNPSPRLIKTCTNFHSNVSIDSCRGSSAGAPRD